MALTEPELHAMLARGGARILGEPRDRRPGPAPADQRDLPEKDLLARVRQRARGRGWLCYHTLRSDGSDPGFPDLTLVKPGRLLFLELKAVHGKLTQAQHVWLDLLAHSVPGVEAYCVRPTDWSMIVTLL